MNERKCFLPVLTIGFWVSKKEKRTTWCSELSRETFQQAIHELRVKISMKKYCFSLLLALKHMQKQHDLIDNFRAPIRLFFNLSRNAVIFYGN